jgi:hypothetical protein
MVDLSFDVMAFSWPSIATGQKSHGKNDQSKRVIGLRSVGLVLKPRVKYTEIPIANVKEISIRNNDFSFLQ